MKRLTIDGLRRNHTAAASGALWAQGASGVQEDWMPGTAPPPRQPWDQGPEAPLPDRIRLIAWFDRPRQGPIAAALAPWFDDQVEISWEDEQPVDWQAVYEASLSRIELPGVTIAPPSLAQPGDLIIDPGCGFGTGEHPTTRQVLTLLPQLDGTTLLDLGSGSGILALAARRRGFAVHGTEIDAQARKASLENARLNGLDLTVDDRQPGDLDPVDVVLANIHAELLVRFAPELVRLARRHLVLAGIMDSKEASVREALIALGEPHRRLQDGEWVALHYRIIP